MSWTSIITNAGLTLLAQSAATATALNINVAKGGSTTVAAPATATDVTEPKKTLSISGKTSITNGIKIAVQITNTNLTEGYTLKQVGLFGKLGEDGTSTLIAIAQSEDGEEIPSTSEQSEFLLEIVFVVHYSSTEEITVTVDSSAYATQADITTLTAQIATLQAQIAAAAVMTDTTTGYVYRFVMENGSLKLRTYDDETANT